MPDECPSQRVGDPVARPDQPDRRQPVLARHRVERDQFCDPGESGQDGHLERWVDVVGTGNGKQDRAEQAWQIDHGLAYALDPVNSLCHVCPLAQRGGLSEPVRQVGQVGRVGHRNP